MSWWDEQTPETQAAIRALAEEYADVVYITDDGELEFTDDDPTRLSGERQLKAQIEMTADLRRKRDMLRRRTDAMKNRLERLDAFRNRLVEITGDDR